MTLYRLTWTARPSPFHYEREYASYHLTSAAAGKEMRVLLDTTPTFKMGGAPIITEIELSTEPKRLCVWLNENYVAQRVE